LNSDCVLGGEGYRPGHAVQSLYTLAEREGRFWSLKTCGVEPEIGRHFNFWALGPVFHHFTCPTCGAELREDDSFKDAVGDALNAWAAQSGSDTVACPMCAGEHPITEWPCKPPLGFGNLSFTFWNWPPLDSSSWKVDIPAIVEAVTSHRIVRTYGHI
jgi:hypothetical protein